MAALQCAEDARRDQLFDLPTIPPAAERLATLLRERPDAKEEEKCGKTFVIVSGLPRSGTSLMMQLLAAGGIAPVTDAVRAADIDNPRGYYEWEPIKRIGEEPELLDDPSLEGKTIKCISMLLPRLPKKHSYKVIFLTRPLEEAAESQSAILKRLHRIGAGMDTEQLQRGLRTHRDEIVAWLATAAHVDFIEVDYRRLVAAPEEVLPRLVAFLGERRLPSTQAMQAMIEPRLYRRRNGRAALAC